MTFLCEHAQSQIPVQSNAESEVFIEIPDFAQLCATKTKNKNNATGTWTRCG